MKPETFGDLLRRHRNAAGMTLKELGEHMGASAPYLCDVESDCRVLTPGRTLKAMQFLGIGILDEVKARAVSVGHFTLAAWTKPSAHLAGGLLSLAWDYLTKAELDQIEALAIAALARHGVNPNMPPSETP